MTADTYYWWQSGVLYQIYPRSFQDSNGDGVGDLQGIIERLDYVQWLGVDALWLSPFYPSPMADFGYDITDYCNVDPIFGDLAAFDRLVAEAHRRNLKILIDFVPNHSSDEHPWFLASRSSRQNPKRDWYVWADPRPDGSPPNNWLSVMGGSAWEWDAATGQYYLHTFIVKQPDLNWRNPEVKAAMFEHVSFWLERGVDGFRIDAAHYILKDPQLRNNPLNSSPNLTTHKPMGGYESQIHLYDNGHQDVHEVYRELRQILDTYSATQPRVMIGEIHIRDRQEWASYYGSDLNEFHMPFNFGLLIAAWNPIAIHQSVNALEASLPPGAWPNNVLGNHDEPRISTRIGAKHAPLAMLLLLTLRGTPTLYYGDELGMHDGEIPPEKIYDPMAKHMPGRDPERTPMQWDTTAKAGFCAPEAEPWLPLPADYQQMNVEVERADPRSLLTLTRHLIQLRHSSSALTIGSYRPIEEGHADCLIFLRESEDQRYLVALNFADEERILQISEPASGKIVLSSYLDREGIADLTRLQLRGNEGCIIELG